MSLETFRVKSEVEDKEWGCSIKLEPELAPELLQAPSVACPLAGTSEQESSVKGPSDECSGMETVVSMKAISHQDAVTQRLETDPYHIKEEEENEAEECSNMSEEAALAELYAGHVVKHELVLGPEMLQAPDVAFVALKEMAVEPNTAEQSLAAEGADDKCLGNRRGEQRALHTCVVRLERMSFDSFKDQFHRKSPLKFYQRTTQGIHIEPYTCDICKRSYAHERNLIFHLRNHSAKNVFSCDVCKKKFSQNRTLIRHKRIHTGEKLYSCDVCNKQFTQPYHLKVHTRIHTGEKPYSCDVCDKQFAVSSQYKVHKRVHTGEKPYSCDVCDKQFAVSSHYKVHRRVHTGEKPYSCDVCDKQFARLSNLKGHKLIHEAEKLYSCDVCNKEFVQRQSLNRHKRIHTGEKPCGYDQCRIKSARRP